MEQARAPDARDLREAGELDRFLTFIPQHPGEISRQDLIRAMGRLGIGEGTIDTLSKMAEARGDVRSRRAGKEKYFFRPGPRAGDDSSIPTAISKAAVEHLPGKTAGGAPKSSKDLWLRVLSSWWFPFAAYFAVVMEIFLMLSLNRPLTDLVAAGASTLDLPELLAIVTVLLFAFPVLLALTFWSRRRLGRTKGQPGPRP